MKIKSLLVAVLLLGGVLVSPSANAATENPKVESFVFTPTEVDLFGADTTVNFTLVVSHPAGIANTRAYVTLKSARFDTIGAYLIRTPDSTSPTSPKVTFKGSITVPRDVSPGVYVATVGSLKNNSSAGYEYETGTIESTKLRTLTGAESALLVRSSGDLNFNYTTFVGPSHDTTLGLSYDDSIKYSPINSPILKVNEKYKATDYFEPKVAALPLQISSSTPKVCTSDGSQLTFLTEGNCTYTVFTAKTKDYAELKKTVSLTITEARVKPQLVVEKIANQTATDLPKSVALPKVYDANTTWVLAESKTPLVCQSSAFYVRIVASGTCTLTYQSVATKQFLASDVYTQTFEVIDANKPVVAPTPTPVVTPTPTAAPVVKKTISCVKGKKTVTRTGSSPKCPKGFKLKK
jgi:hypothetical protein